jgi:hypothetical protein
MKFAISIQQKLAAPGIQFHPGPAFSGRSANAIDRIAIMKIGGVRIHLGSDAPITQRVTIRITDDEENSIGHKPETDRCVSCRRYVLYGERRTVWY